MIFWRKLFPFFCILLLSTSVHAATEGSKESQPFFKSGSFDFFPVPVFEISPDEGLTYGLMPIMIMSDKKDGSIKAIAGMIGQYNSITKIGGSFLSYFYPKPDQAIEFYFGMAQRYEREATFHFFDPTFFDKFYIDASVTFKKSPFGRFFGLGPQRSEKAQSNFTSRSFNMDLITGYTFLPHITANWTTAFHTTDLLQRAFDDVDDTQKRYGLLSNVVDSTNLLFGPSIVFDNRPEREYSKKGSLFKLGYFFSSKTLGSDKNFQGLNFEAIHLFSENNERFTTALRLSFEEIFGRRVPFYEMASLGGDKTLRSFTPLRFVDQVKIAFQAEQRMRLFKAKMFGNYFETYLDPFFEIGRVAPSISTLGFKYWQPLVGMGFRLFVPPNVIGRLDMGFGSDGLEIYTQLGYPF